MKFLVNRWLVFAHRWLAIGTCLLFASWFISGLVLMYVDFPSLTARERATRLASIAWQRVHLTPSQAMQLPHVTEFPRELRLEMLGDEPVYRIESGGSPPITVSAETGR